MSARSWAAIGIIAFVVLVFLLRGQLFDVQSKPTEPDRLACIARGGIWLSRYNLCSR